MDGVSDRLRIGAKLSSVNVNIVSPMFLNVEILLSFSLASLASKRKRKGSYARMRMSPRECEMAGNPFLLLDSRRRFFRMSKLRLYGRLIS